MIIEKSNLTYLNTAGCGLMSDASLAAANDVYQAFTYNSSGRSEYWRNHELDQIRKTISTFLQAPTENIAIIPNFSFGINSLVQALNGQEKVLLFKQDYPSLTQPFVINGFDIYWIDTNDHFTLDMDGLEKAAIAEHIDILAISHVQWLSGFKIDLERLSRFCQNNGIILIIDATQSLGAMEIDLSALPIDVLISSNYKWMNAGFGTGILYMSDVFLQKYPPVIGGANSFQMKDGVLGYGPSIHSYEPGGLDMYGLTILQKAIEEKMKIGIRTIEKTNRDLTQALLAGIRELPVTLIGSPEMTDRASIVFIKDSKGLGDYLSQQQIVVTVRNNNLRISMHFYNTFADVQKFLTAIFAWSNHP